MVVLPAVGAAFLGRWLDARYATGIFWTLSLLSIGLVAGCAAAWRAMNRELMNELNCRPRSDRALSPMARRS